MKKRFLYEFSGTILIEADNQAEAEKLVTGKSLNNYVIDEEVYEIDVESVAIDLNKRTEQFGTYLHPTDDFEEYKKFKVKKLKYNHIFNEFLHGQFDKNELMKRMAEAEENEELLDDCDLFGEIKMITLDGNEFKTVRLVVVD